MAADTKRAFALLDASVGAANVDGASHGRSVLRCTYKSDAVRKQHQVTKQSVIVELYGTNQHALVALIGQAAATLVFGIKRDDNSRGTRTHPTVVFTEMLGQVEIPEADSGGRIAPFGIRGRVQGLAALAAKWVEA